MSGTALSPMALSKDPREITLQVIKELNCSSENDTVISNCLKNAKLEDLLNAKVRSQFFLLQSFLVVSLNMNGHLVFSQFQNMAIQDNSLTLLKS